MPPQHGKSYHFSEHFPAWYMGVHPSRWVAIGAYTGTRADAASEKCRDQLNDPRWPFAGVTLGAKRRADEWSTNYRGEMHSAGIGGSLTGFGANLLAIDDPIKGRQQAYSLTYRDGAWDWYTTVARTRARTPFHQLLGLTRWHDDDLLGRIMNTKGWKSWTLLRLPAIAEADDPLGRTIGEPLWPEDLGGPPLPQVQLGEISSKDFAALYQGDPSPTDGDVFRASWLERKWRDFDHVLDRAVGLYVALDGAWKEGVENDMSALATWALHETEGFGREFSLVHGWTARVDYPKLKRIVRGYAEEFMPTALLVEDAASGIPLVQELRPSSDFPVIGVPTGRASKLARAEAITPLFESGKCAIPDKPSPWLTEWISQHLRFDAGKRDDFVDTTSLALGYMNRTPRRTWGKIDTANRRSN
jgi:predicted phage terminase large subunit-like protein